MFPPSVLTSSSLSHVSVCVGSHEGPRCIEHRTNIHPMINDFCPVFFLSGAALNLGLVSRMPKYHKKTGNQPFSWYPVHVEMGPCSLVESEWGDEHPAIQFMNIRVSQVFVHTTEGTRRSPSHRSFIQRSQILATRNDTRFGSPSLEMLVVPMATL